MKVYLSRQSRNVPSFSLKRTLQLCSYNVCVFDIHKHKIRIILCLFLFVTIILWGNFMFSKFFRQALLLSLCTLIYSQSLSAFLIINQTDKDRVLTLQEAFRPPAEKPGNKERPIPINDSPEQLTIPAKSIFDTDIVPCGVLIVNMIHSYEEGNSVVESTMATCYEPYSLGWFRVREITDDWGLVIHDPIKTPNQFLPPWAKEYNIKLVHPDILNKINSLDELPEELKH